MREADLVEKLIISAMGYELDAIQALVAQGANVNSRDKSGRLALTEAAKRRDAKEVISALIRCGADVNMTDGDGHTPLVAAVSNVEGQSYYVEHISFLIELGANPNLSDEDGETPLMKAALNGDLEIMKVLIKGGAALNAVDRTGETALCKSAQYGYLGSMETLIQAGADMNLANDQGETPLIAGVSRIEVVKILVTAGADTLARDNQGIAALKKAKEQAKGGDAESKSIVALLAPRTANPLLAWL
jgi:ankyrin repeat protein